MAEVELSRSLLDKPRPVDPVSPKIERSISSSSSKIYNDYFNWRVGVKLFGLSSKIAGNALKLTKTTTKRD